MTMRGMAARDMAAGLRGRLRGAWVGLCLLAMAAPAAAAPAGFVAEADWLVAAGAQPGMLVQPMPAQSVLLQDAFGSWTPAQAGQRVLVGTAGFPYSDPAATALRTLSPPGTGPDQWSGSFGCNSFVQRCLGAITATYTLPFPIVGLAGLLDYRFASFGPALDFFDTALLTDPAVNANPFRYQGFYGTLFAPTDTITVTWTRPGDDFTSFLLAGARVLAAPVPEPAMLGVFAAALLALGFLLPLPRSTRHRRAA